MSAPACEAPSVARLLPWGRRMRFAKVNSHGPGGMGSGAVRVGCLPSLPSVSALVASQLGHFERAGIDVTLSCETGAGSLRDRLVHGELDAAVGNAGILYLAYHGWAGSGVRRALVTGLMLGGNVLELVASAAFADATSAWDEELQRSGGTFQGKGRGFRRPDPARPWMLAVDQESSSAQLAILRWLEARRLSPGTGFRIVIVPSSMMPSALASGHVDAFCTSAPWTTHACVARLGVRLDLGRAAEGVVPDAAIMVSRDFTQDHAEEHARLLAALMESARFCLAPEHQAEVLAVLAASRWFEGVSESTLKLALEAVGAGSGADPVASGEPSRERAEWIGEMVSVTRGLVPPRRVPRELAARLFRRDLHTHALEWLEGISPAAPAPVCRERRACGPGPAASVVRVPSPAEHPEGPAGAPAAGASRHFLGVSRLPSGLGGVPVVGAPNTGS